MSEPTGCPKEKLSPEESPAVSAVMFAAGLLGNGTALALLLARRGRGPLPLFRLLVTALVLTDLLGTCLLSPAVLAAYGRGETLRALAPGLCSYFAFAMSFSGLATTLALFAMALDRCLALARPYLYERRVRRRSALLGLAALYGLAAAFCALPLLGFGGYTQYYPGTWCFLRMRSAEPCSDGRGGATFALLYASVLLLLVLAVLLCNLAVGWSLLAMHRRGRLSRRLASTLERPRGAGSRRRLSISEEVDRLLLLAFMTITFMVCSLPFVIRAYMSNFEKTEKGKMDLLALRFLSINPIIDPWVFAILRPSVLRVIRSVLCCQMSPKTRGNIQTATAIQSKSNEQIEPCGQ